MSLCCEGAVASVMSFLIVHWVHSVKAVVVTTNLCSPYKINFQRIIALFWAEQELEYNNCIEAVL